MSGLKGFMIAMMMMMMMMMIIIIIIIYSLRNACIMAGCRRGRNQLEQEENPLETVGD